MNFAFDRDRCTKIRAKYVIATLVQNFECFKFLIVFPKLVENV